MNEAVAYAEKTGVGVNDSVTQFLPLVKKIALHWSARLPDSIELDDLLQVGLIGLLQARDNYDPSQGASFITYASIRIKGAIIDEVRRNDWVPRSLQQKMGEVSSAIAALEAHLGRAPTDAEIAEVLQISLEEYQGIAGELACCRMVPMDSDNTDAEAGGQSPLVELQRAGYREALVKAVNNLPEREQLVMSLYYNDELNLKEIGLVLGVSESRISQLHGQAVARLRAKLGDWSE